VFDLTSPEFSAAPWRTYARLREEAPVHPLAGMPGAFAVSRYDDVRAVLSDASSFSSTLERDAEPMLMVFRDGDSHDRLRQVMAAAFTPRAIAAVGPAVEATAVERLDRLLERGRGDLVREWCQPIPAAAIAEILGVPQDRSSEFRRWASDLLTIFFASRAPDEVAAGAFAKARALAPAAISLVAALGPRLGLELHRTIRRAVPDRGAAWTAKRLQSARGMAEFLRFFGRVLQAQRRRPRQNVLDMLIRAQAAHPPGAPASAVTDVELMMQGLALMTAGIDTTSMLLASGARALCDRPALFEELRAAARRADPEPIDGFVHEVLRLWSPVQWTHRRATRDLEIRGTKIPRDAIILALVGSANRDPARFEAPDELRLDRNDSGHLSFAIGPHACIGRNLALLEARTAFTQLLLRVRRMRLDPAEAAAVSRADGTHGFETLPVILQAE
jgi:cytochrome P450